MTSFSVADQIHLAKMSVFSLEVDKSNPVTKDVLDGVCQTLGVTLKDDEKDDYQTLLAVFHESAKDIMAMPGINSNYRCKPPVNDN